MLCDSNVAIKICSPPYVCPPTRQMNWCQGLVPSLEKKSCRKWCAKRIFPEDRILCFSFAASLIYTLVEQGISISINTFPIWTNSINKFWYWLMITNFFYWAYLRSLKTIGYKVVYQNHNYATFAIYWL